MCRGYFVLEDEVFDLPISAWETETWIDHF